MSSSSTAPTLRRAVSTPLLMLYGLGTMLGAGIYALIGEVAAAAGYHAPFAFLLAAVIAGLTATSFAEFASRYPKSAGEAIYVSKGFASERVALIVGLLIVASGVVSSGVMFRGFVGYAGEFVAVPAWLGFIALAIFVGAVASWGITQSVAAIAVVTLIETGALVVVIALGAFADTAPREPISVTGSGAILGIVSGAVLAFYAFIGFEDMVNIAEEVKRPRRAIPQAIFAALAATTLIYIIVAWVAVKTTSLSALSASDAPMTLIFSNLTNVPSALMTAIAMVAIINGALVQVIMAARVLYGLAQQHWLPAWFAQIHVKFQTPVHATMVVVALVFVAAALLPLAVLAQATSFFLLVVFALINIALIRVKARTPAEEGVFKAPRIVPWFGALTAAGFAAFSLFEIFR